MAAARPGFNRQASMESFYEELTLPDDYEENEQEILNDMKVERFDLSGTDIQTGTGTQNRPNLSRQLSECSYDEVTIGSGDEDLFFEEEVLSSESEDDDDEYDDSSGSGYCDSSDDGQNPQEAFTANADGTKTIDADLVKGLLMLLTKAQTNKEASNDKDQDENDNDAYSRAGSLDLDKGYVPAREPVRRNSIGPMTGARERIGTTRKERRPEKARRRNSESNMADFVKLKKSKKTREERKAEKAKKKSKKTKSASDDDDGGKSSKGKKAKKTKKPSGDDSKSKRKSKIDSSKIKDVKRSSSKRKMKKSATENGSTASIDAAGHKSPSTKRKSKDKIKKSEDTSSSKTKSSSRKSKSSS